MRRDAVWRHPIVGALALTLAFGRAGDGWRATAGAPPVAAGSRVPTRAVTQPGETDSVIGFRLSDQFGRVHDAAEYRGRALLLVGADNGGRATGTAWVETLRGLQGDSAEAVVVPVVAVADLRGLPRLFFRFVRRQFPSDRRQPVLLDWNGTVARGLAFERERCTIVVVGPTGRPYARSIPGAVDTAVARALLRQAASMVTSTAVSGMR